MVLTENSCIVDNFLGYLCVTLTFIGYCLNKKVLRYIIVFLQSIWIPNIYLKQIIINLIHQNIAVEVIYGKITLPNL